MLNVLNLINQYTTRKKILLNIISPAFVVIEKIIIKISKYLLFETAHHRCLTTFSNYLNLNCNPDQLFPGTSLKMVNSFEKGVCMTLNIGYSRLPVIFLFVFSRNN